MACIKEAEEKGKYGIEEMMDDHEKGIIRCQICERTTDNPRGEPGSMAESFLKTFNYSKTSIEFYEMEKLGKLPIYACEVCVDGGIWNLSTRERKKLKVAEAKID